jgi:PAS domain S-box-containing protein
LEPDFYLLREIFGFDLIAIEELTMMVKDKIMLLESSQTMQMQDEIARLVQGFAAATTHLMTIQDGHESVQAALAALGAALNADRSFIFERHHQDITGDVVISQRWEWVSEGISSQIDNPDLQNIPINEAVPRWYEVLATGETIASLVKDLPESEQSLLVPQGIVSILLVPIFIQDNFWGLLGFDECEQERIWEDNTQAALKAIARTIGNVIDRRRNEAAAALRSEQLLHGVTIAANHLLSCKDEQEAIQSALNALGPAFGVDRIYIFVNHPHPDSSEFATSQRWEWVADGITPQIDNPEVQNLLLKQAFPQWYQALSLGRPVVELVQDLSEVERRHLSLQGILSVLIVPIFIKEYFWGFIGFDDCHQEKIWENNTLAALVLMASSIGSVIAQRRTEAALRQITNVTATFTGADFFPALIRQIVEELGVRYAGVSHATPDGFQVLAFFADGAFSPPQFIPYDAVPCCVQSLQTGSCCHPHSLQTLYPDNTLFTDLQIESYLGVRLNNAVGDPIGNLSIFHDRPLADPEWAKTLLSIFAVRAGAELERMLTSQAIQKLNTELEERVIQRTTALAEREAFLQDFLDNANDLIQIVNLETGQFEFVNRSWREILNYKETEIEQMTVFDIVAPDYIAPWQSVMQQMQSGSITKLEQIELAFVNKSGQTVLVEGGINCRYEAQADGRLQPVATRAIFRDVTIKKQIEQELGRREVRYRSLMESAADAILLANPEGYIVEANRKAEEMFGYSLPELTTLHFSQLHPPAELPKVMAIFTQITQTQRSQAADINFLRRDGTILPVDVTASCFELNGEVLIQGIFRDISERKKTEELIRSKNAFLNSILENLTDGLCVCHSVAEYPFVRFTVWNHQMEVITGYSQTEINELGWYQTLYSDPEVRAKAKARMESMREGDNILGEEWQIRHRDGSARILSIHTSLLPALDGQPSFLAVMQDITERQRVSKERQRLLQELSAFKMGLDQAAIVTITDIRGIITYVNHRFVEISGYSVDELLGKTHRIIKSDVHSPEFYKDMWGTIARGDIWRGEVCNRTKDGRYYWVDSTLVPFFDDNGKPERYLAFRFDITEQKQASIALQESQQSLTQRNEELIRATRLKDEFLANMSHELRTPLNAILGMSEGLKDEVFGAVTPAQINALTTIESSGTHLLSLINDILDLSKIESGQMELDCTPTAIDLLCQSSIDFIKQQAFKKQIHVSVNVPSHLSAITIDERRIRQVLINLLNNAVKFTPKGGRIALEVSVLQPTDLPSSQVYLRFAVKDNGIGISQENISKLFQPFIQIDSALNRQYEGTGLGLALTKQIVELHGGRVGLTSELGMGSCFTIDLPYQSTVPLLPSTLPVTEFYSNDGNSIARQKSSPLILLAEDNEANISTICSYLTAKGYRIEVAKDGLEAIDRAETLVPNLILMDIQMPNMNGLDAIQRIREIPTLVNTPIIALTALAMEGDRSRCLAAGATDYMSKPVKLKQLVECIQSYIAIAI